jgi:D-glycero-alpha-D-manno-heptose-7-phosphate kinase
MIQARAPLRISFGGGGTDLPAYYEPYGGLVLSTAIQAACHVRIGRIAGPEVIVHSDDYRRTVTVPPERPVAIEEPLSLPRAVLSWFEAHGHRPQGMRISLRADVAPGSGLGSSSAMTVALVAAIARFAGQSLTRRQIAEIACDVEIDLLERPIGRQDQFASACGGLNLLTFSRAGIEIAPARLSPVVVRALEAHLLLMSTRRTRDSATVLRSQRDASSGDGDVVTRLHCIKSLAAAMYEALVRGDLPGFGALLDESWQLKRGLSQRVSSPAIDRWYGIAKREGAYGGKIAGAGGGGHFIFCVPPVRREKVIAALAREGLTPVPVAFDTRGCVAYGELLEFRPAVSFPEKGQAHDYARSSRR